MHAVYSNWDSVKVGMIDGVLRESGIPTFVKNWSGSNITEIPIPALYPTVCVLNQSDIIPARNLIQDFLSAPASEAKEWICHECGVGVDGVFTHCWNCQAERKNGTHESL